MVEKEMRKERRRGGEEKYLYGSVFQYFFRFEITIVGNNKAKGKKVCIIGTIIQKIGILDDVMNLSDIAKIIVPFPG
jgi:hypothetical protein